MLGCQRRHFGASIAGGDLHVTGTTMQLVPVEFGAIAIQVDATRELVRLIPTRWPTGAATRPTAN